MENQVNQVIDKLAEKFGLIIDWSQQNIQIYVQDLMNRICKYEITTSIMWIMLAIILVIPFIIWFKWACKKENKYNINNELSGLFIFSTICIVIFGISSFIIIIVQITDIFTAIYIPEKLFINTIQDLI